MKDYPSGVCVLVSYKERGSGCCVCCTFKWAVQLDPVSLDEVAVVLAKPQLGVVLQILSIDLFRLWILG